MNELTDLALLRVDGVEIRVVDSEVKLIGVLSTRSPSETVTPFFRQVHAAALRSGTKALTIDLTELRFMNSSSIRTLVDWVEWIRREPVLKRYVLNFVTKPDATWQDTTMTAIRSFGGEQVTVRRGV